MLCYDRTKGGVNGPQLARLTQRRRGLVTPSESVSVVRGGLGRLRGFMDVMDVGAAVPGPQQPFVAAGAGAAQILDQIKNFFGSLFGKSADKAQFDMVRQNVWLQFAALVDAVDALKRSNQLTREQLENYMRSLHTLIENFDAYYTRVRAAVTPAYGDSRFHDFFDVFQAKYDEWKNESLSMPASGFFGNILPGGLTSSLSNMGSGQMLMLGALALAIFSGSRRSK